MSLTPYERETIIGFNDEDDFALITTYQRTVITKLRKNPAAKEVTTPRQTALGGAMFELPASCVSFRNGRRAPMSEEHKAKLTANATKAREARGK